MKELFYFKKNIGILNYTKAYPTTFDEVLVAEGFTEMLKRFLESIREENVNQFEYLCPTGNITKSTKDIIHVLKALTIYQLDEIDSMYLTTDNLSKFEAFVEDFYDYWRHITRYSLISTQTSGGFQLANFIEADSRFNQLILSLYRTIQEKVQGKKNRVYRQLNAGTNACIVTREVKWDVPFGYDALKKIPFIDSLMLRTPLIIHTASNKRYGSFEEVYTNPFDDLQLDRNEWLCFPAKIGELLTFIYFHRDFMSNGISLGNLFEMASAEEYYGKRPDLICLFGVPDGKKETSFYLDKNTNIYIGYLSHDEVIEYFGYIKKMALTLHNLEMMKRGRLPIHGSMVDITLKNGVKKGVMFIGDSGAGKSETIEALRNASEGVITKMDVIFDDMGCMTMCEDHVFAQGTETGAFVRLDDLEKGTAYRDMDRSVFMNPENNNARVIIPTTEYENVVAHHKVDMLLYANNYTDAYGLNSFKDMQEGKKTFAEGKRFALGTTHESGMTSSYFANPFGPLQKQELCDELLDKAFKIMYENDVYVGEIYTRLGVKSGNKDGIKEAATALLELLNQE
ncbi:MAG: hypothetical protein E7191_00485 [Erysipelotrichaceae bacterium]|nr:hypothetical protein [Erysipelotrichaceae bacterium]